MIFGWETSTEKSRNFMNLHSLTHGSQVPSHQHDHDLLKGPTYKQ